MNTGCKLLRYFDTAMEKLGKKDHDALVLRFFEGRSFADVGAALEARESEARMRVNRALEKLRKFFAALGMKSTAAAIAETISANSVQVAPAALAKTATGAHWPTARRLRLQP